MPTLVSSLSARFHTVGQAPTLLAKIRLDYKFAIAERYSLLRYSIKIRPKKFINIGHRRRNVRQSTNRNARQSMSRSVQPFRDKSYKLFSSSLTTVQNKLECLPHARFFNSSLIFLSNKLSTLWCPVVKFIKLFWCNLYRYRHIVSSFETGYAARVVITLKKSLWNWHLGPTYGSAPGLAWKIYTNKWPPSEMKKKSFITSTPGISLIKLYCFQLPLTSSLWFHV